MSEYEDDWHYFGDHYHSEEERLHQFRRRAVVDELVEINGIYVVRDTEKAILVLLEDGDEVWIPKSQVHSDSEVYKQGQSGTLAINKWFSDKEGLTKHGTARFISYDEP